MYSYATFFLNFIFIICASYVHFKTFYVFISMRNVRILCVRASYVHFYAFYVCIFMRNVYIYIMHLQTTPRRAAVNFSTDLLTWAKFVLMFSCNSIQACKSHNATLRQPSNQTLNLNHKLANQRRHKH